MGLFLDVGQGQFHGAEAAFEYLHLCPAASACSSVSPTVPIGGWLNTAVGMFW